MSTPAPSTFAPGPLNWRYLDAVEAAALWDELIDWVEWLRHRYGLTHNKLPGCWPNHPAAVEELTALMAGHTASYQRLSTPKGQVVRYHDQMIVWHRLEMWSCLERIRANAAVGDCTADECNARPRAVPPLTSTARQTIAEDLRGRAVPTDVTVLDEVVMAELMERGEAVDDDSGVNFAGAVWTYNQSSRRFHRAADSATEAVDT
ncbi:hypothetical protein DFR67_11637 [Williamsia limnetica]|uniref:Uncharacterized protein n=1 Tax=Williamsia limnetica TaxID=882452 RepID=A0A318RBU9_WILLI|nr:hypothetical protein [Williamsia limnetica]PYE13483.1 hypothetical protein DFR67_11637 [Williamsia limnetica]